MQVLPSCEGLLVSSKTSVQIIFLEFFESSDLLEDCSEVRLPGVEWGILEADLDTFDIFDESSDTISGIFYVIFRYSVGIYELSLELLNYSHLYW